MKKGEWITCDHCEVEFRVLSDTLESVAYCPFCSEPIESDDEEDEFDDSRDYDYGD